MAALRKPLQGVRQIILFNRHQYIAALVVVGLLLWLGSALSAVWTMLLLVVCGLVLSGILFSLLASLYVYDLSGLYTLKWMPVEDVPSEGRAAIIHAGFDEFGPILKKKYPALKWTALDFYDPSKHTEISIKRARKAFPPEPLTVIVETAKLGVPDASLDMVTLFFAAHEIRSEEERQAFFNEVSRVLKPSGQVVVLEHLRDLPNFLAYSLGFFHFYSRSAWKRSWRSSGLQVVKEQAVNPFVRCFILKKNGNTS